MRKGYFVIVLFICLATGGFTFIYKNKEATTAIHFKNLVGNKELKLFDETYTNNFGEPFVINKFRYYISHISIVDGSDKEINLSNNYYLVNEDDSLSKMIQLPAAGIKSISFLIGVDSAKNISGVQTGSLDPMNGMFWTWNSGYVFAKLEGQSDSSHAPAHSFTWDVGGFRARENALRRIKLNVPAGRSSADNVIVVQADILKWFSGAHPLKISQSPVCHQPGVLAMQIADNYSAMFSIAP
ncbi:MAG: MbnP family protein [Bacteroidota bacterium]